MDLPLDIDSLGVKGEGGDAGAGIVGAAVEGGGGVAVCGAGGRGDVDCAKACGTVLITPAAIKRETDVRLRLCRSISHDPKADIVTGLVCIVAIGQA